MKDLNIMTKATGLICRSFFHGDGSGDGSWVCLPGGLNAEDNKFWGAPLQASPPTCAAPLALDYTTLGYPRVPKGAL